MKKGLTELVFVLDRSGSMGGLELDTIGGFNSMVEKQKKEDGEAFITTFLFDDKIEMLYDRVGVKEIAPMTDKEYFVRGATALLDAVGEAIEHISNIHKYARVDDVPEKTIFIITTDGMENSSKKYSYEKLKRMVEEKKEKNQWEFLFLGANMDAIEVAGRFGIESSRAVTYQCDGAGTALNYKVLNNTVAKMRACANPQVMSAMLDEVDCFAEIREDYAKRGEDGSSKNGSKAGKTVTMPPKSAGMMRGLGKIFFK